MPPLTRSSTADNVRKQPERKASRKRPLGPGYQENGRASKRRAEVLGAANLSQTRTTIPENLLKPKRNLSTRHRGISSRKARKDVTKRSQATPSSQPQRPLTKKSTASTEAPPSKKVEAIVPLFKIMNLATELQLKILKNLDYKTLLHISATCKHFRELFLDHDKEMYKLALVAYEEECIAWRTSLKGEATFAPCYGCLKTFSRCHFSSYDWHASSTATGVRAFRRRCATCLYGRRLRGRGRVIDNGRGWLFCGRCKQLTHLVQFEWCGLWDHTRGGKVWCLGDNPLPPQLSLCKECKP